MKKRNIKPYSKKKVLIINSIGITLFVIAFVLLLIASILQERGYSSNVYLPFGVSFFPICFIDIVFYIYHYKGLTLKNYENQMSKNKENSLDVIEIQNFDIDNYCNQNKFKLLTEGYYHRRKFNINKDYINFFIKRVVTQNLSNTLENEFRRVDQYNFKKNNKCFILYVEMNEVQNKDLDELVNVSNYIISREIIPNVVNSTIVVVLADKLLKKAYFSYPGKNKLSYYACGYKFVKKMLNNK